MKKNTPYWLIFVGIGLFLLIPATASAAPSALATLSYLGMAGMPKGMRNNNPGNIRISSNPWQGKIPLSVNTDGAFEQFEAYVWGIRAMIKNLLSYQKKGWNTLRGIIEHWAPGSDGNDTNAYLNYVVQKTGLPPDAVLTFNQPTVRAIVIAMTHVENGRDAVTVDQFNYAWSIV